MTTTNKAASAAKTLYKTKQPDDFYKPCSWVNVSTWRADRCVITVTAFEGHDSYVQRVDGYVLFEGEHTATRFGCPENGDRALQHAITTILNK